MAGKRSGLCDSGPASTGVFGCAEGSFRSNGTIGVDHKDGGGEWFVAKAEETIDTIYWEMICETAMITKSSPTPPG